MLGEPEYLVKDLLEVLVETMMVTPLEEEAVEVLVVLVKLLLQLLAVQEELDWRIIFLGYRNFMLEEVPEDLEVIILVE